MKDMGAAWAAFSSGAIFSALTFFLLLSVPQSLFADSLDSYHQYLQAPLSKCRSSIFGQPAAVSKTSPFHAPRHNVFAELSSEERGDVVTFLYENSDILNLTERTVNFDSPNWINQIEVLRPNKSDAVSYLGNGGPEPDRYATVSVVQNDGSKAFLAEYQVGPIPVSNVTRIQRLVFPHNSGRNDVQTTIPDMVLFFWIVMGKGNDVQDITEDLLGAKVNMLDPLGPNSLGLGARPILIEEGRIIFWLEFFRTGPGSNGLSLLPQGLYVKLDVSSLDPDDWTTSEWFYNGVLYPDIDTFRKAWNSSDFVKTSRNLDGAWTNTEDFTSKPRGRSQPPPLSIQPYGPRYQLDRKQQYISWMGFSFYLATSPSTALSLFDIRFNDSRIVYHLGLQEALAHYAGSEPIQSGLEFLDTLFGMGSQANTLVSGYDCPAYADYLGVTYHKGERTYTNERAICVFEFTSDAPLQRHTSEWSVTISRNTYLVVRSVSTVGNYDYTIDYLLYLDGSIEVKVRASGFIFGAFAGHPETRSENDPSNPDHDAVTDELRSRMQPDSSIPHPNSDYGYQIHPSVSTSLHDHVLLFRCDLDISPSSGFNDTFQHVSIDPYTHTYPWDGPNFTPRNTMHLTHHPALSNESPLNWPRNSADLYLIQSPELNAWGEHKAYRIQAGTGMGTPSHLTIFNSTSLRKSAAWSSADLWVLKNHPDTEPAGAHYLNYLCPNDPLIDFAKMADNETLADQDGGGEDLVVYFNLGGHHVPHSGDIPNTLMHTSASSVILSPFNYFDEDVSKASRQGVRVDANTREDVGWVKGMRVVGGGRYEDAEHGTEGKMVLDVKKDLEPDVGGYFEADEKGRPVGKMVGGGLWGWWPTRGD